MVKIGFHQLELHVVPLSLKFSILLRSIPDLPKNSCIWHAEANLPWVTVVIDVVDKRRI